MTTNEADLMGNMPEFGNGPNDDLGAPEWVDEAEGDSDGNR